MQYQYLTNAILNTIFNALPEEIFIVVITLSFLKIYNLLDILTWKHNLKLILLTALPVSIMINIFRYVIIIPKQTMMISTMIMMIILIECIVIKHSFSINIPLIFKTAIYTIGSFVIIGVIEYAYCPILLSLLHKDLTFINDNVIYNILCALPIRILYLCIISFIIVRKNNKVQINLFDSIIKNNYFVGGFLLTILSIASVITYIAKLVKSNSIIIDLNFIDQLVIVAVIISVPILLVTCSLIFVNYLLSKEKGKLQVYENVGK